MSHPINFDLQIAEHEEKIAELKRQKVAYGIPLFYYVIGGEYVDTTFTAFKHKEERYGPFVNYEDAAEQWRVKSWQNVDSCHTRYQIKEA